MTDLAALLAADKGQPARILHRITAAGFEAWLAAQPPRARAAVAAAQFKAKADSLVILPGDGADDWSAAAGVEAPDDPWSLATAAAKLPEGIYRLQASDPGEATLGWLLAQHRFDRYRESPAPSAPRILLTADPARIDARVRLAQAVALVRDMVDTPAGDMGPAELAEAAERVAAAHGAKLTVTQGDALAEGYPMIHAVGRAATRARAPRLIELEWGDTAHPRITIVGKGVCFDTGGLDIKPSSGMLLMKKDMGGAAHALALAGLVMGARLPVRLHLLIPAVENAISADAFRPGDILRSRAGLHVEIGNTDAEGRLILGDALAKAAEGKPALMLDFATLTGAARVALGPDLPALFANEDALADALLAAGTAAADPLWRLPLWAPYTEMLKSDVADINNAGQGGFAGAITAALFLQRFVPEGVAWAHLDTFAWSPSARPGRPKGGDALGLRAAFAMLRARFG
ncbi:leucyl aminopeptidase family protein [Sphingomonas nostoxanthinifaciens]|uniref:leucyl aminopeptidase family protein n=1 Tax=Sphingomonas nostoxanthinifaciens TaxID=2872652 RepID=UPI001CC20E9C|nr:leucyl aminopeptidase family protein [Sphingomonas nostoxanthinifaciens]UAK22946.1 leucyl aminopeptidase family protein [Sphingomonas nostoxanthinifaciens]